MFVLRCLTCQRMGTILWNLILRPPVRKRGRIFLNSFWLLLRKSYVVLLFFLLGASGVINLPRVAPLCILGVTGSAQGLSCVAGVYSGVPLSADTS